MPTISFFFGITITMYWDEHPPPHFHARCGGKNAVFEIGTGLKTEGALDPDKERLVLKWAKLHESELWEAWELCRQDKAPKRIAPLYPN